MEPEKKIVKILQENGEELDTHKIKKDLDSALAEYEKVKKLIDYFVLGLMLIVVLYTLS